MMAETDLPRSALVLGLARSGEAAALALVARGVQVRAADRDEELDTRRLREAGVEVRLGADDPALLDGVDLLVKSPGVPTEAPLVAAARERAVAVWSEVELGYRLLPNPILGVTGTNGKTTTSELLGAIFRAAGRTVEVAGNVGRPLTALAVASELDPDAWIVTELSSFQLEDVHHFHAPVAVLLNVTPDHLDRHGTIERYREAKLRIFENQSEGDTAIVPRGFGPVPGAAARVEFATDDPLPAEPALRGEHNRENAAAAAAAARATGIRDDAIAEALRRFSGVPHRLEPVGEHAGVRYVNDSKATNPEAAERALTAYDRVRLIAGGSRKGTPFASLARAARERRVLHAYLIGESAGELAEALAAEDVPFTDAGTLEEAVRAAAAEAERGDVVLLAPACASFDQFRDYEERGDRFRALVEAL